MMAHVAAVWRFDVTASADAARCLHMAAATSCAAMRFTATAAAWRFEDASLLFVLMLEGLHFLGVLALKILLAAELLLLDFLLIGGLSACECLGFLLLAAH